MENLENIENQKKSTTGSKRSFDVAFLAESDDTREKSAFTKYNNKERKNVPQNNINTEDNGIDTSASNLPTSNSIPPNINMMQFPALRKLLDITGMYCTCSVINKNTVVKFLTKI